MYMYPVRSISDYCSSVVLNPTEGVNVNHTGLNSGLGLKPVFNQKAFAQISVLLINNYKLAQIEERAKCIKK